MNESPVIQMRGVAKSFGSHAVLRDLNLSVERGQTFAFLGTNALMVMARNGQRISLTCCCVYLEGLFVCHRPPAC